MRQRFQLLRCWLGIFIGLAILTTLVQCQPRTSVSQADSVDSPAAGVSEEAIEPADDSDLTEILREQGIVYVRSEYHQAQMGLSLVNGGGEFGPLTTSYEWWLDVQNPARMRRVTTEWLEDGPHVAGADGADGGETWWQVDTRQGMVEPVYHSGAPPFAFAGGLDDLVQIFTRGGEEMMTAVQQGEAEVIEQREQAPWGRLSVIHRLQAETGHTITATVRAEVPFILMERVTVDRDGRLFETMRITDWAWLDPADLPADFWLNPLAGIPIGP